MENTRTIQDVKAEFARKGASFGAWADSKGLPRSAVYDLLSGRTMGKQGNAHNAAVLLGLKEGEVNMQKEGSC